MVRRPKEAPVVQLTTSAITRLAFVFMPLKVLGLFVEGLNLGPA